MANQNAFVSASLRPEIIDQLMINYLADNVDNVIQLNNILLGQLLEISRKLGCPVWMDDSGIVQKCISVEEFYDLRRIYGELGKAHLQ